MPQLIREHDMVALLRDLPGDELSTGEVGAVVFVHHGGSAFEVEFPAARDRGLGGVITVEAVDLLRLHNVDRFTRSR